MEDFEKLGVFYLGKEYDLGRGELREDLLLYDSKDLVTHGVCVGMTGSGKTGLCISLLEEAAIDGIPALIIDPKGDLPNLLLTFPELRPEDFRPWVDEGDASRKGLTPDDFASSHAANWKEDLQQKKDLDAEFEAEVAALQEKLDASTLGLTTRSVKPRKTDVDVALVGLVWLPYRSSDAGGHSPAWS